ncbi:protein D3 isoform X1 [Bemisia tabaci]|uniref:protein D3 isoform X1 n=2 Tax=Bemisia tabaci TaxID=7038 RepID=UPI003B286C5C
MANLKPQLKFSFKLMISFSLFWVSAIIPKNRVTCAESDEYVDVPSYTGTEDNEFECTSQHHGMGWNDRLPRTDATIRADLIRNGIIPEFIIKPPKYEAFITFHGSIEPDMGNILRPEQVRWAPHAIEFKFKPNSYYCIVMTGLDEPSKAMPTKREFLHWIVGNMPEDNLAIAEHIAEYYPVLPKKDTGLHRYLLLVYEQKKKIDFKEFRLTCRNDWGRAKWSSRKFADKYKLGEPYAVNFFYSEYTAT